MSAARRVLVRAFSWALLTAVIAGALALIVVPMTSGARPLTVLSGSMSGTYEVGDAVIVRPVDTEALQVGDVITFQATSDDPTLTTHRVIGIVFGSDGREFQTQGDANNAPDLSPIKPEQVKGEVWYSVPFVGYLSVWVAGDLLGSVLDLFAFGLLIYGGFVVASELVGRRRGTREVAEESQAAAEGSTAALPSTREVMA